MLANVEHQVRKPRASLDLGRNSGKALLAVLFLAVLTLLSGCQASEELSEVSGTSIADVVSQADAQETVEPPAVEAEPPVEEAEPPVEEAEPPVEEAEPPVDEVEPPVEEIDPPVDEVETPVAEPETPDAAETTNKDDGDFLIDNVNIAYFVGWPLPPQIGQFDGSFAAAMGARNITWIPFPDGGSMADAMFVGDVDIAYSMGLTPFAVKATNGVPMKIVGVPVAYDAADDCIVSGDLGYTRENAAETLNGATIMTPVGNITHFKLLRTLDFLGVDQSTVTFLPYSSGDSTAGAFDAGVIDVGCAFGSPLVWMAEGGGVPLLTDSEVADEVGIKTFDVTAVSNSFAEEHPDVVTAFLSANEMFNDMWKADPAGTNPIIADAAGMQDVGNFLSGPTWFTFPSIEEQLSDEWLGDAIANVTQEQMIFFQEQGQIRDVADDYTQFIDTSFLERAINPEAFVNPSPEALENLTPGEGVDVTIARADWSSGFFQAEVYKLLLEELGYDVSDPSDLQLSASLAFLAMSEGEFDFWANSWYPGHLSWLEAERSDGTLVGDHLTVVGNLMESGGLQGFLITKSVAEQNGITTLDQLFGDPALSALFDSNGNGLPDLYGCPESWTCDNIITEMACQFDWSMEQIQAGYDTMIAEATDKANAGQPMVMYTWTPSSFITKLTPGENVMWISVEGDVTGENCSGQIDAELYAQPNAIASIGADRCLLNSSGECNLGWTAADIQVTANTKFLQANPAAAELLDQVVLPMFDVAVATAEWERSTASYRYIAERWLRNNRALADSWLEAARAAG